jgi:hypothetical protein
MAVTVGTSHDAVVAQQAVVATALAAYNSALATLAVLQQSRKAAMVAAGVQEGSKSDPRPTAERIHGGTLGGG